MRKKAVYSYELRVQDAPYEVQLPEGAEILHVDCRLNGDIHLLAMHFEEPGEGDEELKYESRYFKVVGTGWSFDPEALEYVGTVYSWHVFEYAYVPMHLTENPEEKKVV